MFLKIGQKIRPKTSVLLLIAILASICIFCSIFFKDRIFDTILGFSVYGPLSLDEALNIVPLPIHSLNTAANFKGLKLKEVYYYFDSGSELTLATYFTIANHEKQAPRVAKMLTYNVWGGPDISEVKNSREVPIWGSTGSTCMVLSEAEKQDRISGEPYQSCFFWIGQKSQYKLYTVWPEDVAVKFINELIEVKKRDEE